MTDLREKPDSADEAAARIIMNLVKRYPSEGFGRMPCAAIAQELRAYRSLVVEACAEVADAVKQEKAESRDKHELGIEPGHDDWIAYNHGVFTAGEIAAAIRALKGESK